MPAAGEVHAGVALGDLTVLLRVLEVQTDGDDLVDSGRRSSLERLIEESALVEKDEVAVGVDQGGQAVAHGSAPTTTVHSPRGGRAVNSSTSAVAVPRWRVSCTLVNSRATTSGRSPRTGVASRSVLV